MKRLSRIGGTRSAITAAAVGLLWVACTRTPVVTDARQSPKATQPASLAAAAHALPDRLSDKEFWALETAISEPGAFFQIRDNFTSNDMEVGRLFSMLRDTRVSGDVYMGVGPEQNFTYIAAVKPRMAFIVDIRRQAIIQHLMFKAIFEMAKDRIDFISLTFSKPRPMGIDTSASIQKIWEAYRTVATDSALGAKNYARIADHLTKTHGFALVDSEMVQLKFVFDAFYAYGPAIATRGNSNGRGGDFSELTGFSTDASGQPRSFLSSEENYRVVKGLHERNLIVPVSGEFGGNKAIRAIGTYLTEHHGLVRAFYVSNVEQYLFSDRKSAAFYDNVATLPVDSLSVFIRPYSLRRNMTGSPTQPLCPIAAFLAAAEAGRVSYYEQSLSCGQ